MIPIDKYSRQDLIAISYFLKNNMLEMIDSLYNKSPWKPDIGHGPITNDRYSARQEAWKITLNDVKDNVIIPILENIQNKHNIKESSDYKYNINEKQVIVQFIKKYLYNEISMEEKLCPWFGEVPYYVMITDGNRYDKAATWQYVFNIILTKLNNIYDDFKNDIKRNTEPLGEIPGDSVLSLFITI